MLGGYQILDLRSIDLSRGASESSISDASVLIQLLNIRDHIQKTYDFSKPLHAQLKPLLIRYRDKKVGEKHEVALYGNIEVINTYYKFRIIANNEGEQLTINVEFEEKTDEYDNKYWSIKTAKILLTTNKLIEGDLVVTGSINGEENPSVKPIYWHTIRIQRYFSTPDSASNQCNCYLIILNNQSTLMTQEEVMAIMKTEGFYAVLHSGVVSYSGSTKYNQAISIAYYGVENSFVFRYYNDDFSQELTTGVYNFNSVEIQDLGVNKLN